MSRGPLFCVKTSVRRDGLESLRVVGGTVGWAWEDNATAGLRAEPGSMAVRLDTSERGV